jgi:post-segregation antitoxin (ccd killing protein)
MHDVNKKSVMVYLDPKIVAEARELGLNISKICENALKMAIEQLRPLYKKNNPENRENVVRPPGFEPGSPAREAEVLPG